LSPPLKGGVMKKIFSIITHLVVGLNVSATIGIFALTTLVVADVLGRVFLNKPIAGVPELAKLSIVAITFLQIPYVMLIERHIRSTVLLDHMPKVWQTSLNILTYLIGMIVFAMFFYGGWDLMVTGWSISEYEGEGALRVPTSPNRIIIELGSALMVILCCWNMAKHIKAFSKKDNQKG